MRLKIEKDEDECCGADYYDPFASWPVLLRVRKQAQRPDSVCRGSNTHGGLEITLEFQHLC